MPDLGPQFDFAKARDEAHPYSTDPRLRAYERFARSTLPSSWGHAGDAVEQTDKPTELIPIEDPGSVKGDEWGWSGHAGIQPKAWMDDHLDSPAIGVYRKVVEQIPEDARDTNGDLMAGNPRYEQRDWGALDGYWAKDVDCSKCGSKDPSTCGCWGD